MTPEEERRMQELEGKVKRYRSRIATLKAALTCCSFQLATLVAATGEFTDANAQALDAASAALGDERVEP